jgi:hypothetical protein
MSMQTYRGVIRGGVVVFPKDASPLDEGTEVEVKPVNLERGAPAAVLAALDTAPQVPAAWVDELEQLIDQGRRPPTQIDPFAESE